MIACLYSVAFADEVTTSAERNLQVDIFGIVKSHVDSLQNAVVPNPLDLLQGGNPPLFDGFKPLPDLLKDFNLDGVADLLQVDVLSQIKDFTDGQLKDLKMIQEFVENFSAEKVVDLLPIDPIQNALC